MVRHLVFGKGALLHLHLVAVLTLLRVLLVAFMKVSILPMTMVPQIVATAAGGGNLLRGIQAAVMVISFEIDHGNGFVTTLWP